MQFYNIIILAFAAFVAATPIANPVAELELEKKCVPFCEYPGMHINPNF
jgi:hypothetical protein